MSDPCRMKRERLGRGLKLNHVAGEIGIHQTTLVRIESGDALPKRDVARKLFKYYGGSVPLGDIYDATFADAQK